MEGSFPLSSTISLSLFSIRFPVHIIPLWVLDILPFLPSFLQGGFKEGRKKGRKEGRMEKRKDEKKEIE
jgi:hypothetical protein